MKTIISLLIFLSLYLVALGDDIIVLKNGDIIRARVLEIGKSEIKYKKISNQKGPTYNIPSSEVFSITYENGEKESFYNQNSNAIDTNSLSTQPASDNKELLAMYSNIDIQFNNKKQKKEEAKSAILVYKLTENSILSNQELSISFESGWFNENTWFSLDSPKKNKINCFATQVKVKISNKSDKLIYLDLKKSYRNGKVCSYRNYYDGTRLNFTNGDSHHEGIGIGLFSFGNTNFNETSYSKEQLQLVAIPPKSSIYLPPYPVQGWNNTIYERYDYFSNMNCHDLYDKFPGLLQYGEMIYNETNSPDEIKYIISYYSEDNMQEKQINFSFYIFKALGLPPLYDSFKEIGRDKLNNLVGIDSKSIIGSLNLEEINPSSFKGGRYDIFEKMCISYGYRK